MGVESAFWTSWGTILGRPLPAVCLAGLNLAIWIKDDWWLRFSEAYRIMITIRYRVRLEVRDSPKHFQGSVRTYW